MHLEGADERRGSGAVASEDEAAAGVAVEAVDESWDFRAGVAVPQQVQQSVEVSGSVGSTLHREACRNRREFLSCRRVHAHM
jgi:hypothetical protein